MFADRRGKRVLLLSHCLLNQNAKIDGCAHYPGVLPEVFELLGASGCGIVQLPCPEIMHLGLDRQANRNLPRTIESEDTRVAALMQGDAAILCCRRIAKDVAYQAEEYLRNGFAVLGMIGINESPTCGVETTWRAGGEIAGQGVLIRELQRACARRNFSMPMRGIKAKDPTGTVRASKEILGGSA